MNGSVTLNDVTDEVLIKILETKAKHSGQLSFSPQQMQVVKQQQDQPQRYNNVLISWGTAPALAGC